MTDQPDPGSPDDPVAREWFRSSVDPIIDADPIPDAWGAIAARVGGQVPAPVPVREPRGRWLAVAAVLIVLTGLIVVGATRRDGATTSLSTEGPPTGLYIPQDLPEGWHLRTAWASAPASGCRGSGRSWEGPAAGAASPRLELTYLPCGAPAVEVTSRPGPGLGHGVDRSEIVELDDAPDARLVTWDGEGAWSLRSEGGMSEDDLIAAAGAIVADPASTAPPLPGMVLSGMDLAGGAAGGPTVSVSLSTPDGTLATYHLNAPGDGPAATPLTFDEGQPVDGQDLPVARRAPRAVGVDDAIASSRFFRRGSAFVGFWPGADIDVPRIEPVPDAAEATVTQEGRGAYDRLLIELLGSLRPATAEQWHDFLATADHEPSARLLAANQLTDLTGSGATPDPSAAATTTTAPAPSEPTIRTYVTSSPGTPVERAAADGRLTPLDGLELRLEVDVLSDSSDGPVLRVGEQAAAKLVVHNSSDSPAVLTECTLARTTWGLVPADEPDRALPDHTDDDCAAFPEETVPPGGTVRLPIDWRQPAGFVAQRPDPGRGRTLGPLPEGAYLATVDVPGRTSDVRLQLEVQVPEPACPVSDATIAAYLGISPTAAREQAASDGFDLALASVDGDPVAPPVGVRCDRVNVDVWHGLVVNATVT